MNTQFTPKRHGFPNYFKKIGIAVVLLVLLPVVLVKTGSVEMAQHMKHMFGVFTMNALILGLLLIALANDKVQDEMTIDLKIKTMAFAFVVAVLGVIIRPIFDLISHDPVTDMPGQGVVLQMLLIYLFMYHLRKRKM